MKRVFFILAMLTAVVSMYGQSDELYKWVKKNDNPTKQQKGEVPNLLHDASVLLNKSATYQYVALGCGGGAAGLAITASIIGTKDHSPEYDLDKIDSDRKLRRNLYIGAGVLAAAAICFEIVAIDYKTKAGHKIKLYSTGTGGGVAYIF